MASFGRSLLVATLLAAAHAQTEDTIMFAPKQSTPETTPALYFS